MDTNIGDIIVRGIDSACFSLDMRFDTPESPLLVAEKLTVNLAQIVKGLLPKRELDYIFFEGAKSKNLNPGYAITGNDPEGIHPDDLNGVIVTVKTFGADRFLDYQELTNLPKRTMFFVDAPYLSPLARNDYRQLRQLHRQLQESLHLDVQLGREFYSQLEGTYNLDEELPSSIIGQLQTGMYVWVASRVPEELTMRIYHGHVRKMNDNVLELTPQHFADQKTRLYTKDVIAIFGKGFEPIYHKPKIVSR